MALRSLFTHPAGYLHPANWLCPVTCLRPATRLLGLAALAVVVAVALWHCSWVAALVDRRAWTARMMERLHAAGHVGEVEDPEDVIAELEAAPGFNRGAFLDDLIALGGDRPGAPPHLFTALCRLVAERSKWPLPRVRLWREACLARCGVLKTLLPHYAQEEDQLAAYAALASILGAEARLRTSYLAQLDVTAQVPAPTGDRGRALIMVGRPFVDDSTGWLGDHVTVSEGGATVGTIGLGGVLAWEREPGTLSLTTSAGGALELPVAAGRIYRIALRAGAQWSFPGELYVATPPFPLWPAPWGLERAPVRARPAPTP